MRQSVPSQETEQEIAAALVDRIRAGDRTAEQELFDRYSRGLLLLLTAKTRDRELAKDLRQDTFVIAIEKLRGDGLDEPDKLAAYLSGIARNLVIGDLRKKMRRKTSSDTEFIAYCADDAPNQLDQMTSAEAARHVRTLLHELPVQRDRDLLTRFYVYEQDKKQICRDLDLDSLHFNRVLFRAKKRFRELAVNAGKKDLHIVR